MTTFDMTELGTFTQNTHEIMVSDPCYVVGTWCQGIIKPVLKGQWRAFVEVSDQGEWGDRIARLRITHESVNPGMLIREDSEIPVGVDSGQAGFWDIVAYRNRQLVPAEFESAEPEERWYEMCCKGTLSKKQAAIQPFGAISSTGFGDGRYDCFVGRNPQGLIVGAELVFISEEDEAED